MRKDTIILEALQARNASFGFDSLNMDYKLDDN
jgi:hypothetical protein